MISFIRGTFVLFFMGLNVVYICSAIFLLALVKIVIPGRKIKLFVSKILIWLAELWAATNSTILATFTNIKWDIQINAKFDYTKSYLVLANHQTWADIVVLQKVLNRKIPFLRFFIKRELMYVPFLNLAWWALDFPFLNRYSPAELRKNPGNIGRDIELARKSCEKFRELPASILIFAEGTRFTDNRKRKLKTPLDNLLPAKTGGISTALDAMGEQFDSVLDVTMVYPKKKLSFWNFAKGQISPIVVRVDSYDIPKEFIGPRDKSKSSYAAKKKWINDIWLAKDGTITKIKEQTLP